MSMSTTMMTSKMMNTHPPSTSSPQPVSPAPTPPSPSSAAGGRPLRTIPGGYGWPLLGPIADRLDYFWFQGPENFFRKRIDRYKNTVFRTNVPPSFPFFTSVNPNVVAVLDCESFSHLFDMDIVEKRNTLVGDFFPSVKYTGDTRVCVYLDTSEPQHTKLKSFAMDILKRSSKVWVSELVSTAGTFWDTIDTAIAKDGSASYDVPLQKFLFRFLSMAIVGADPAGSPAVAESGYLMIDRWLALQLLPITYIGSLQPLVEMFLHSWSYPFFLVSGGYKKLYKFIESEGKEAIDRAKSEFGLSHDEAIHNLLFIFGFNAFGGFSIFFPTLINAIASDTTGLQAKLRKEVKEKLGDGSTLSFESVKELELVKSVVYETLRFNPPVPLQYARARKDFQLRSHDSAFEIKKGELLCGYQKLVMRDPKVFNDPETFKPDRFVQNSELLNYLYWSNGPQTGNPSDANKQCAAKDYVTLTATMFVAHMFQRYDSITGTSSKITAVQKAT